MLSRTRLQILRTRREKRLQNALPPRCGLLQTALARLLHVCRSGGECGVGTRAVVHETAGRVQAGVQCGGVLSDVEPYA